MKTRIIVTALAACVLAASPFTAHAFELPKPTAEITKFEVESITLRDITFLFELTVKNPYILELPIDGITLDFSVEGAKVFTAKSKGSFRVKANGTKANTFTVTLSYEAIMKLVKDYVSKDYLKTVVNGKLVIALPAIPGLPKDITFDYRLEKKIPAIKPKVSIVKFEVKPPTADQIAQAAAKAGKAVDPAKALGVFKDLLAGKTPSSSIIDPSELDVPLTISFTVEIKNEAKAAIGFSKLSYELYVNGDKLVSGETTEVKKDGTKTLVTVTSVFSSKLLTKNVKALFASRKGSFKISGSAEIKLPDEIRKTPVPLAFSESGDFSLK